MYISISRNATIMISENQSILSTKEYHLSLKREDLLFSDISGNKFRKLKYQLKNIQLEEVKTILTFGGAFSNHIAAVASAGEKYNLKTIGIIRGEELAAKVSENPTLSFAREKGMNLVFVSREEYRQKEQEQFIQRLTNTYGDFHLIPEGGTNELAIKGCAEILTTEDRDFEYICVPVGTGGTMAGIVSSLKPNQFVIGFSALKGTFQDEIIKEHSQHRNFKILDDYCFGGYAKIDESLINFINEFKAVHRIQLDPVYTGKMMYGIYDLMKKSYFKKNSRILAVHTGGIQGIAGMNLKLQKRKFPLIDV